MSRADHETTKAGSTGKRVASGCLGVVIGMMMFGVILGIIFLPVFREIASAHDLGPPIPVLLLENPWIWLGMLAVVAGPGFVRAIRNWRKVSLSKKLGAIHYDVTDGGGSGTQGASPLVTATQTSIELSQLIWRLRWSLLWAVLATFFFMVVISVIEGNIAMAIHTYYMEHGKGAASPGIQELVETFREQIPADASPGMMLGFSIFIPLVGIGLTVLGIVFARRAFRAAANL